MQANAETTLIAEAFAPDVQSLAAPVVLTTTVNAAGAPVAGAALSATVTRPDGSESSIVLLDNGVAPDAVASDGIYSGMYLDTNQSGFYVVDVVAEGNHNGLDFRRTTATVFSIAPNIASLQGSYGDSPIDADGNGLYEYLKFEANVEVVEEGTVSFSAMLTGNGGQLIDQANQIVSLITPGTQQVTMRFSGEAINASGIDGPYTIVPITLLDDNTFIFLDEDTAGWQTAAYTHDAFGNGYEIYLPLVARGAASGAGIAALTEASSAQATANYNAVTDSNGDYTIAIPSQGKYTVVPVLSGYTFSPAVQMRSLPPSASGVNFTLQSTILPPPEGDFNVTKLSDTNDGICDSDCSLREAIVAANSNPGNDVIALPAGFYQLTITGIDEDEAASGDLDIISNITIEGAGANITTVNGNDIDRVFDIIGASEVSINGLTIEAGNYFD